jgi:hypothetical protein
MKTLSSLLLALLVGASSYAAQIGDTVESKIPITDRVNIPRNLAVEVTHIDLEDGVWSISGSVQMFEGLMNQVAIVGGSINDVVALETDGTQVFMTILLGQFHMGLSLASRDIEVNGNQRIYLVGYNQSAQTTLQAQAWGFISARKIRNNH